MVERIDQDWLYRPSLQALLNLLGTDGGEAKVAGGAVRNALLGQPISDVDIATTLVPRDVMLRLKTAGHKIVPTGIEHGTVTAVIDGEAYEITTLRQDVEADGRHAKVLYGTDWKADARRRDLTINALYLNPDGSLYDPLNGLPDIEARNVRFIDDAETRIGEDYLRILRFFRFFAWYGKFRPDAEGLKACARLKDGLSSLSAERIWHELSKLLAAPDSGRAILWMCQTGVLGEVLPETEKWGIDALPGLIEAEQQQGWEVDCVLRLMAIVPPMPDRVESLGKRLKLPKKVRMRLSHWADTDDLQPALKKDAFYQCLYWQSSIAVGDKLRLAIARADDNSKKCLRQLKWLNRWQRPQFPLRGQHLIDQGMAAGPAISERMTELEKVWVAANFELSLDDLLNPAE